MTPRGCPQEDVWELVLVPWKDKVPEAVRDMLPVVVWD